MNMKSRTTEVRDHLHRGLRHAHQGPAACTYASLQLMLTSLLSSRQSGYICVSTYTYAHVHAFVRMYVCMYVCMHAYTCICNICACTYIYIEMDIQMHTCTRMCVCVRWSYIHDSLPLYPKNVGKRTLPVFQKHFLGSPAKMLPSCRPGRF